MDRPIKITFADMRAAGVREILVYLLRLPVQPLDALMADRWPDELRLQDRTTVCVQGLRQHGADVRPHFSWSNLRTRVMGYR